MPGLQDKVDLVAGLGAEVRRRDHLICPADLLEDLYDGERLDQVPELGQGGRFGQPASPESMTCTFG